MNERQVNDVEWPKDEDHVPERDDYGDGEPDPDGDAVDRAWDEQRDRELANEHLPGCGCTECEPDDDYGPDDDGGEGAAAF